MLAAVLPGSGCRGGWRCAVASMVSLQVTLVLQRLCVSLVMYVDLTLQQAVGWLCCVDYACVGRHRCVCVVVSCASLVRVAILPMLQQRAPAYRNSSNVTGRFSESCSWHVCRWGCVSVQSPQ